MQSVLVPGQLFIAARSKSPQADSLAWYIFRPLRGLGREGRLLTPGSAASPGAITRPPALLAG